MGSVVEYRQGRTWDQVGSVIRGDSTFQASLGQMQIVEHCKGVCWHEMTRHRLEVERVTLKVLAFDRLGYGWLLGISDREELGKIEVGYASGGQKRRAFYHPRFSFASRPPPKQPLSIHESPSGLYPENLNKTQNPP